MAIRYYPEMAAREIHPGESDYPKALASVADAPRALWVRGQLPTGRAVAVVGARAAGPASIELAEALAGALARAGIAVVSGGAVGVDGAAHRGALAAGGATVVVFGTGIDVVYPPQHAPLFDEVVAHGGALVSQYPPGMDARGYSFPLRNRVVAAMSEAVVIVEASARSGALLTARAARDYGRTVIAVLGSPGCDGLLACGALPARTVDDVLARIAGRPAATPVVADERAARLLAALDETPRDLGELAARAGVRPDEALALAVQLEIGGLAARAAGGRYLRLNW